MSVTRALVFAAAVAVVRGPTVLCAQTPSGLSERDAVAIALRHSPDLEVARLTVDSARGQGRAARAYPNPVVQVIPNTPTQYSVTLPLDVGPQRRARTRIGSLGVDAAGWDERDAERQVTLLVQRAYYDILLADERRRITEERRATVRQLATADSLRVRAGALAPSALARSPVELARAESDVVRARVAAQQARLALEAAMGVVPSDTALVVSGDLRYRPVLPPEDSAVVAGEIARRPDVVGARTRIDQSVAARSLARSALLPIPALSYVRQRSAPFESGKYYALGIGVELPVFNFYSGERQRAEAGVRASAAVETRVRLAAERDARSALADLHAQAGLVESFESGVLSRTAESVEAARYAYQRGATSLLELLDALRAQQDVRIDYALALHDYWVSVRTVEAQLGTSLPVREAR
jgi:cobalt-zinc-cadmium efflux system outer membrane protein